MEYRPAGHIQKLERGEPEKKSLSTVAFENEVSSCSGQILEPFYLKLFQP